ncbi:YetF domain-containing protein [[Bacillus] enclensis]|uniref:YetF domain-containing protein n=1 Tax=[Bacillus] enclensis TaxID=1402860 RepID=UPI00050959AB
MEEYGVIIIRTLFLYLLITFIFRMMGKREIGELSILDLVVFIMIAEMAVLAIEEPADPIIHTILPMGVMVLVQFISAWFSLRSKSFREMVDGKPTVLIHNGKIDEKAMKKQRYNFDDLLLQLREKDVFNLADVEFAVLEPSGSLSVLKKEKKSSGSLTLPLILDGQVQTTHLDMMGKTAFWLRKELRERGYRDLTKISFCSFHNGKFHIDMIDN